LPMEPEDYIHRIGRTGRIGAEGKATSFATLRDRSLVKRIERLLGNKIPAVILDQLQLEERTRHSSSDTTNDRSNVGNGPHRKKRKFKRSQPSEGSST
jgi:ATP-dependent RNA helicase RhlE